jgi:predicted CoA-binding protein
VIYEDADLITNALTQSKTIAVLGIKTEEQADQPAFYVPKYAQERGYDVIPVPVYYPDAKTILGKPVYRKLADIPERVDMVDVFRRSKDIAAHYDDIVAAKPKFVWLQLGITENAVAKRLLEEHGIVVIQNRCLLVELRSRPSVTPNR